MGTVQSLQETFPLLSLLLSTSKFLPVHFPKLLRHELQKARWRADTGSDYCQGKQWFKAILSFVEIIYFGFVAPKKSKLLSASQDLFSLEWQISLRGCTQPGGHCGTFCLLFAPTVTCTVLWASRCVCGT